MGTTSLRILQAFMCLICATHVIIGISVNTSSTLTRVITSVYGAHVDWTSQFVYILKPLGAFIFVFGLLAAVAAINPLKYRAIVYGFVILFVIWALQRLIFTEEIYEAFAIDPARNMIIMVFIFALAVSLFALYHYVERRSPGQ